MNHSIADAVAFAIKTPVGTVVMTGGNALYLSRQLRNDTFLRPDLVLFGLRRILSDNR